MKKLKLITLALLFFCLHATAAVIDTLQVESKSMHKKIQVLVITPQQALGVGTSGCPSLYLLNGYGGNGLSWLQRTKPNLPKIADQEGWYIIIPDGNNSWYWDSPVDTTYRYETFMTKELLPYIDQKYNTIKDQRLRAITGYSMGGQGALYLAMRHKDLWGNAGSMSGGVDITQFPKNWNFTQLLGNYNNHQERWKEFSIPSQIKNIKDGDLNLIFGCGSKDFFFKVNEELHQQLLAKDINHDYIVRIGEHNHPYWNNSIDYQILFFRKKFSPYYTPTPLPEAIRIACIGNSITYGYKVSNRIKNCYPNQLNGMLGDSYEVGNFGKSGCTLLNSGDRPYTKADVYSQSLAFEPDYVTIMLGTNDSKPQNMEHFEDFKKDYKALINSYRNLKSNPKIILLCPTRCYLTDATKITDKVIQEKITPMIKEIAQEEGLECWDLYPIFEETYNQTLLPDRLHPSSLGQTMIASFLYEHLCPNPIQNKCLRAIRGSEYRAGAGWKQPAEWNKVSEEITKLLAQKKVKYLFLGNSITQGMGGYRSLVTSKPGKEVMEYYFGKETWETAGISGDRTQQLLWRIKNGNYNKCKPEYIVITIGVNNILAGDNALDIAQGIKSVATEAQETFPQAKIILQGLLPVGKEKTNIYRKKYYSIHQWLKKQEWGEINYIDPTNWFTNQDGSINTNLYINDYIHLNRKGYDVWAKHLKEHLK